MDHLAADACTTVVWCHLMIQELKQEESVMICWVFGMRYSFSMSSQETSEVRHILLAVATPSLHNASSFSAVLKATTSVCF